MRGREQATRYFVSPRWQFDKIVDTFATLDEAFFQAAKHSKTGAIFFVWQRETNGSPRVRAFADAGVSRWAKPCPQCTKRVSYQCVACGGLALVEDT